MLEDIVDKIIEETMEMKGIMTIIETEIGQEKEHLQEIYTLVSKIHENADLVLGIKNIFELS